MQKAAAIDVSPCERIYLPLWSLPIFFPDITKDEPLQPSSRPIGPLQYPHRMHPAPAQVQSTHSSRSCVASQGSNSHMMVESDDAAGTSWSTSVALVKRRGIGLGIGSFTLHPIPPVSSRVRVQAIDYHTSTPRNGFVRRVMLLATRT